MSAPGKLIASGRDADIFEFGPGLVLRRSRDGHSMVAEARVMEYARANGYPVPAVGELNDDGTELVMERIDGPLMVATLGRRPWTIRRQGTVLADLHRRLHEIPAPDWVPAAPCGGRGNSLVHLDLHPMNVILTQTGPVVIDWANASRGDGDVDIALSWVLIAAGAIPAGRVRAAAMGWLREFLIRSMLAPFEVDQIRELLPIVVEWKVNDPHMSSAECRAMLALVGGE